MKNRNPPHVKGSFKKIKSCLSTKERYYHLCLVRKVKIQPDMDDNIAFEHIGTEK